MTKEFLKFEQRRNDAEVVTSYYESIPSVVQELLTSSFKRGSFFHVRSGPLLSEEQVVRIIKLTKGILFPGHFAHGSIDSANLGHYLGRETMELFKNLSEQIALSLQHDCLSLYQAPCPDCKEHGHRAALKFVQFLPELRSVLAMDIRAALDGDPAAKTYDEIILAYPCSLAITVYRIAHKLYELEVPLLPRMMTEYAHSVTGIDIHPGARIGESFFIDHGTGVVVGETTKIGNRVRLYQGVTLGALSLPRDEVSGFRNKKRHPTIEDDVIIYSNATILGAAAVIGARAIIGGNVWITKPVPPDTKVLLKRPEVAYKENNVR
jgi:serine O-acetyltransferase